MTENKQIKQQQKRPFTITVVQQTILTSTMSEQNTVKVQTLHKHKYWPQYSKKLGQSQTYTTTTVPAEQDFATFLSAATL